MFRGNKGEWSEIYTLIRLLGQEKLFAADENLEKIKDTFFFVQEIIKNEFSPPVTYISDGYIKIIDNNTEAVIKEIPKKDFLKNAIQLYRLIKESKGRSFQIPQIEDFLKKIEVSSLKTSSKTTADIHVRLHDPRTELQPKLEFSIKSFIGSNSTLFNPGAGTNFIYKLRPKQRIDIKKFNQETYQRRYKLSRRLQKLEDLNVGIKFIEVESDNLYRNLFLIDSDLPRIVSQMLLIKYLNKKSSLNEIVEVLEKENPLSYPSDLERSYYKYKIKRMLRDMSMGMTSETPWNGDIDASGGTLVVKDDGEIVCYHVYDIQKYEEYLLNNTYLETPSTGEDSANPGNKKAKAKKKYFFGWLYKEKEEIFMKLNLQVRYKS